MSFHWIRLIANCFQRSGAKAGCRSSARKRSRRRYPRSTRVSLEFLEDRSVPATVAFPTTDFMEGSAAKWSAFASDSAVTAVSNDASQVKIGSQSIKFDTQSGFDTGIRYSLPAGESWDLTSVNTLSFWTYGDNNTPVGFQGNQPIVVLSGPGGSFEYEPQLPEMANHTWSKHSIPLAGGANQWNRTVTGTPSLTNITDIEIHQDTWDFGFSVYYDGLHFWSAGSFPPPGPPPPPDVNPDEIAPRVLLYVFDPIMENKGGVRMHQAYGWADPVSLTNQVVSDFKASSHGLVEFNIVDTQVVDAYPYFDDGYQHDDTTFVQAWESSPRDFHPQAHFDYVRFTQENNIVQRIDSGDLDEVWIYAPPISGLWESAMGGSGAYWVNGPTQAVPSQRAFVFMGWNFERGVGEAIHSFGHRSESMLDHIYGTQSPNRQTTWDKFTFQDRYAPGQGLGGVGNVHFPVNGSSDYDYFNPASVVSNADDWANYPNFKDTKRVINAREWSSTGLDPQREYLNWWYSHLPHFPGRGNDYYLANWWRYLTDVDQFKASNGNLYYTTGIPTVHISGLGDGSQVSGKVTVTAQADVDGALGRVDLYVDGVYYATDTMSPYNFVWDTLQLSGQHSLIAKAYDLQNGTEAVSAAISVVIAAQDVNHAPTFAAGGNIAAPDDGGQQVLVNWATKISAGPAGEGGQKLQFAVRSDNENLFLVQPAVDASGKLTFTPRPNASGSATLTVVLRDDGGTAHGGVDASPAQTFVISITKPRLWRNSNNYADVNDDTFVVADDVNAIINRINASGSGKLPNRQVIDKPYYDTDGDGECTASDVLKVINYINARPAKTPDPIRTEMPIRQSVADSMDDLLLLIAEDTAGQTGRSRNVNDWQYFGLTGRA
jgi:hypothetical protein